MKQTIKNLLQYFVIIIILYSCSSQAVPTGGKKDTIPPQIVGTSPINKTLNFRGKNIELQFDEMIAIENLKQELLITPQVKGNYKYETKKNRLILNFEENFNPNTTYTLNFRKAIKDVTEKNIAENTKLVFSTGNSIDSLNIKGNVKDLLTNKPIEDGLVLLYRVDDTLTITKHAPYYLTKTDKKGDYSLENIKNDNYKVFALSEKNNNQKYDQEKEKIGFLTETLTLTKNLDSLNFNLVVIDTISPKILRTKAEEDFFQLDLNEGLVRIEVKGQQNENKFYYQLEENNKIKLYNTINRNDSIPIQIMAEDSAGNILTKEIKIKFNAPTNNQTKGKVKNQEKFVFNTTPKDGEKIISDFNYEVDFNLPVSKFDLSKISLLADTISPIETQPENFTWNNTFTKLAINKKISVKKNIRVIIPKETFFSVKGDTSAVFNTTHELKDPEDYGTISGSINTDEKNFIIQLIGADYKVVAEERNRKEYNFNYLNAGKYMIRIIIDTNGNGKWDAGNFNKRIAPEKILYHKNEISLKENWDYPSNDFTF